MGMMKKLFRNRKDLPEVYTGAEIEQLENYIQENFGNFESVLHEIVSPDIHVDIAMIPPTEEREYYTLITMGMGAHRMNVPKELAQYQLERAELIACLPSDWKIGDGAEEWYWPLRWLKILARLPIEQDTWLGYGHTVPAGEPFAGNTQLCCAMLTPPLCGKARKTEQNGVLELKGGGKINFYQMFPLYEEEMDFKIAHDMETLFERFGNAAFDPIIRLERKNYCAE